MSGDTELQNPIAPKHSAGTMKVTSAGRVMKTSGPKIPNVKSNAQAKGLTTVAKR